MSSGKIFVDRVVINTVTVFQLVVENPNGILSATAGDLAFYATGGVTWQCRGGTRWVALNGQASVAQIEALQQKGTISPGNAALFGDGVCDGFTGVEDAVSRGVDDQGGAYIQQDTTAILGNSAYLAAPLFQTVGQCRPYIAFDFALPSLVDVRFVAGISLAGLPAVFDSDDPAAPQCMIQFSAARGDVNFQIAQRSVGAQVLTDTGIAAVANRRYTFIIDAPELGGAQYRENLTLIDRFTGASFVLTNTDGDLSIGTIPFEPFSGIRTNVAGVNAVKQYGLRLTLRGPTA